MSNIWNVGCFNSRNKRRGQYTTIYFFVLIVAYLCTFMHVFTYFFLSQGKGVVGMGGGREVGQGVSGFCGVREDGSGAREGRGRGDGRSPVSVSVHPAHLYRY